MTQPAHRQIWSGLATESIDAPVGLLGIPFDGATSFRKGAALAPDRIRSITPHIAPFTEDGVSLTDMQIRDYGDIAVDLDWERYFQQVQDAAQAILTQHPFTIFIGGDHSVTIPLTRAFDATRNEPFGIIHIDAHTDLMDTFEGHAWSHASTARRYLECTHLAPDHVIFIGIRSWLQEELDVLDQYPGITVHNARSVYQQGILAIADAVIQQLAGLNSIYLTLDIDCLDPAFAPGTGTPEAGGLSTRELLSLLGALFTDLPITAMDIVEVSPPLDHSDITSMAAIKIVYEVLGFLNTDNSNGADNV